MWDETIFIMMTLFRYLPANDNVDKSKLIIIKTVMQPLEASIKVLWVQCSVGYSDVAVMQVGNNAQFHNTNGSLEKQINAIRYIWVDKLIAEWSNNVFVLCKRNSLKIWVETCRCIRRYTWKITVFTNWMFIVHESFNG